MISQPKRCCVRDASHDFHRTGTPNVTLHVVDQEDVHRAKHVEYVPDHEVEEVVITSNYRSHVFVNSISTDIQCSAQNAPKRTNNPC